MHSGFGRISLQAQPGIAQYHTARTAIASARGIRHFRYNLQKTFGIFGFRME